MSPMAPEAKQVFPGIFLQIIFNSKPSFMQKNTPVELSTYCPTDV